MDGSEPGIVESVGVATEALEPFEETTDVQKTLRAGNGNQEVTVKVDKVRRNLQEVVNDLYERHGSNLMDRADLAEILAEEDAAILPHQISREMVRKAGVEFNRRVAANVGKQIKDELVWKVPVHEATDVSYWNVWKTECGRYRVVRAIAKSEVGEHAFFAGFVKPAKGKGEPQMAAVERDGKARKFRTLEAAFLAAEAAYCEHVGCARVRSNRRTRIAEAELVDLDRLPQKETTGSADKESEEDQMSTFYIKVEDARKLLSATGHPEADPAYEGDGKWDDARVATKINRLADLPGTSEPEDAGLLETYKRIVVALGKDKEILLGEAPAKPESNGKPSANGKVHKKIEKAKEKAAKEGSPDKKPKPVKTEKAEVKLDKFGYKIGTRNAQINALLSKTKAKTVKQLREEGNIPGGYRGYLDLLLAKGFVTGNHDEGFKLA